MSEPRPSRNTSRPRRAARCLGVTATAAIVLGASGSAFAASSSQTPAPIALDADQVSVSVQSRTLAEYFVDLLGSEGLASGVDDADGDARVGAALAESGLAGAVAAAADDEAPLIPLGVTGGTFTASYPAQVDPSGAADPGAVVLDYIVPDSSDPDLADVVSLVDGQGLDVVVNGQDVEITIDPDQTTWPAPVESDEYYVPDNATGVYSELTIDGLTAVDAPDSVDFETSTLYGLDVVAGSADAADDSVLSVAGFLDAPETILTGTDVGFVLPTGGVLDWTGLTTLKSGSATLFTEDFDIEELDWTVGADARTATASLADVAPGDYTLSVGAFDAGTLNDVVMFADIEVVAPAPEPTPAETVIVTVPVPSPAATANRGLSVDTGWEEESAGNGLLLAVAGGAALLIGGGVVARRRVTAPAHHRS